MNDKRPLTTMQTLAWIVTVSTGFSALLMIFKEKRPIVAIGFLIVTFCICPLSSSLFKKLKEKTKFNLQIPAIILSLFVFRGSVLLNNAVIDSMNKDNDTANAIETTIPEQTTVSETSAITTTEVTTETTEATTTTEITTTTAAVTETTVETETAEVSETVIPETTVSATKNNITSVLHGELLSVIENEIDGKSVLIIKTKITSSYNNHATISQNYFNVEDIILNQGGSKYDEIQYWAVADMMDGSESKVVAFTIDKDVIDLIIQKKIPVNTLDEYATDVYILPSLLN